jgi:hypothetical protein
VDLDDVLSIGELVVRIERAYAASLKGKLRSAVEALFNVWNVGLSLSAGGFTATLSAQSSAPETEAVLLRLLDLSPTSSPPAARHLTASRRPLLTMVWSSATTRTCHRGGFCHSSCAACM